MSRISELFKERGRQASRAADAERKGFPGAARAAREAVAEFDRRIEAAQAEEAPGPWGARAHP